MIERVEIRETVADAAGERRVVVEQSRLPRDREHVPDRARVLGGDPPENRLADRCIGDEFRVPRRDGAAHGV